MADRAQEALERVASDPRRQFGWGPSALASPEEKRAYQALQMMPQVQAGTLPVSALPEEYGGRPTGTSRRAIRMAAAYDEAQERALEQQRLMQQMEQARLSQQREGWRFNKEQNEYAAQLKLEALNERDAAQEASEANSIVSGLEAIDFRADPEAGLKIDQLVLDNPLGAARPDIAKRLDAAKRINEIYGSATTAKAEQEANKAKAEIINKAYAEGLTEQEIEGTKFADPTTGIADYNYAEIERLTARKEGERKTKEPEEKEEYKPISLAQAEDQLAEAEAELDAISEDAEGETLVNAQKKVASAKVRVERARAREGTSPAKKTSDTSGGGGYIIGRSYQGMTYLGGDPNKESSWKKK